MPTEAVGVRPVAEPRGRRRVWPAPAILYPLHDDCCMAVLIVHATDSIGWRCTHRHRSMDAAFRCATYALWLWQRHA
jgi:hypothetical protein